MDQTTAIPETPPSNQAIPNQENWSGQRLAFIFPLLAAIASEALLRGFGYTGQQALSWGATLGRVGVLFTAFVLLHNFAVFCFRFYKPDFKNLLCLTAIVVGALVTVWTGLLVSASLSDYLLAHYYPNVSAQIFWFAIPFSVGALLLQSILGLQYGLVFSISLTLIVTLYFPAQPLFALYALSTCLISCLSLTRFRTRTAFLKAGANASLIGLPFALAFALRSGDLLSTASLLTYFAALMSGIISAFLASGVAPLIEYLGGYVTDMRLLEMATIDHPLLKDLSIQAPGTWNHCMVIGMMVEAAADAIHANPVLVRVGAYFHDIGKIRKPDYFVENKGQDENRHDKLSPSMSALIIRTHVKDGIELARKHGLPKAIQDMIPQHHGTSRIEFFYDKARKEAQEAGLSPDSVDESLYRYPGPKPQTREAGILMLADGIEAAARTLSEPTFDRIQGMVQKKINKVFASGELDECDITLRDLHKIAKAFTRALTGIYHQRVSYAEPAEKTKPQTEEAAAAAASASEAQVGGGSAEQGKQSAANDATNKAPAKENLKRLGL